jgi:transposase
LLKFRRLLETKIPTERIEPLTATAIVSVVGGGKQFRTGQDLAAWLGLTPPQYSTGSKTALLGFSKRVNRYVRRLLIQGACSCVMHLDGTRDRLGAWVVGLESRMNANKVVVALENRLARIDWVILNKPFALYEHRNPRFA